MMTIQCKRHGKKMKAALKFAAIRGTGRCSEKVVLKKVVNHSEIIG